MKKDLLELIYQSDFVKALKGKGKNFHVDDYAGICLTFASLFNKNKGKYLLVCPNLYNAQNIVNFLSSLLNSLNVEGNFNSSFSITDVSILKSPSLK